MYEFTIPIGDWSQDGHNQSEKFVVKSSLPPERLREAYLASCRLTGYQFHEGHHIQPYDSKNETLNGTALLCRFEDFQIPENVEGELLEKHGLNLRELVEEWEDDQPLCPFTSDMPGILMAFIGLSIDEEWTHEVVPGPKPLFGYYEPDLNISVGYGLFLT